MVDQSDLTIPVANQVVNRELKTADETEHHQNILITAKGGGLSFIGRVFEFLVRFVFSILVARTLGAEQYGLYTLGLTAAQITSMVGLLGLQTGMVRFLAPAIQKKEGARIRGIIQVGLGIPALLSLIFAAVLFLLSEQIAVQAFHDTRLIPIIQLVSLSVPLDAVSFVAFVVLISYKQPKYLVLVSNIFTPLAKLILTVGFLWLGWGTYGAVTAHVLASAVGFLSVMYFVNVLFPLKQSLLPAQRNTVEMLKYSLPVHIGWIFTTLRGMLETVILGLVGLTAGVGIYAITLRLSTLGSMFYLAIGNMSTPVIAEYHSRGKRDQLKSFYHTTTKWLLFFNVPLFFTFALFAKPILSIFGADYTAGAQGMVILALGCLVYTGTGLGANILDMTDHTRLNSANSIFTIFFTITLDLLLIPRWGVLGAATASAFSTVLVNFVCMGEVFILLKMLPYDSGCIKPVIAGVAAAGLTSAVVRFLSMPPLLTLAAGSIFLWGSYAVVLALLGFSKEDQMIFASIVSRLKGLLPAHTPAV